MKKILFAILIMICSGYVYAQQDSVFVDYTIDEVGNIEYRYCHDKDYCPALTDLNRTSDIMSTEDAEKRSIKRCPYCAGHKAYKFSKTYVPIYFTDVREFNLKNEGESRHEWTEAENGFLSESGAVWISIAHERVTREKISEIKAARTAIVLSAIASGLSATAGIIHATKGNYLRSDIALTHSRITAIHAGFMNEVRKSAEDLEIAVAITNVTDQEIQINNLSQGRVWYLLPGQTIDFGGINTFTDQFRIEQKTADGPVIDYYNFNVMNHLIRVKPIEQKEQWRSFRSIPLQEQSDHLLNTEDDSQVGFIYEYNIKTGAHRRVEQ